MPKPSNLTIGACLGLIALTAPGAAVVAASTDAVPGIAIELTPRQAAGKVSHVEVRETFSAPKLAAGAELVRLPIIAVSIPSAVTDPAALTARDAQGPLPLSVTDDPVDPTAFRQVRHWHVGRATQGDVVLSYRATPRIITPATRPGPLIDMRTEGSGFYGAASMILALPDGEGDRRVTLHWNLGEMGARARGVTSLGEGDYSGTVSLGGLRGSFLMAGPVLSSPADGRGPFAAYWLTPASFDLQGAVEQTEKLYRFAGRFWRDSDKPFRIFMRTTERFQGGGGGQYQSFIFGTVAGQARDAAEVRGLMAHETMHNWIGGMGGAGGQWFSEGANVYFTNRLTYRAGLIDLTAFADEFNDLTRSYYLNPRSNLSNEDVTKLFWSDGNAQVVPYQRGPLYFAVVDARLRHAGAGGGRVEDLVRQLLKTDGARRQTPDDWQAALRERLGDAGVAEFDAMMAGKPLDMPSDMLGPCFRSEPFVHRRTQLGFRLEAVGAGKQVGRLDAASPAALAGVRDGDILVDAAAVEAAEKSVDGPVTVTVRRGTATIPVTFQPVRDARPGIHWVRTDVPVSGCDI